MPRCQQSMEHASIQSFHVKCFRACKPCFHLEAWTSAELFKFRSIATFLISWPARWRSCSCCNFSCCPLPLTSWNTTFGKWLAFHNISQHACWIRKGERLVASRRNWFARSVRARSRACQIWSEWKLTAVNVLVRMQLWKLGMGLQRGLWTVSCL